jgi:hypothetical protein
MKEYNIGDKVWWATGGVRKKQHTCPVCYGKCVVTLILGNDEQVQTYCDYCGKGYEMARGYVIEREYTTEVKQIVLTGKEVRETMNGRSVEYRCDNYILYDGIICDTKEDAEAERTKIAEAYHLQEMERLQRGKENNVKSYSWHVGYHQRQLKKAQQDVDYHTKKITYMKAKSKSNPEQDESTLSDRF